MVKIKLHQTFWPTQQLYLSKLAISLDYHLIADHWRGKTAPQIEIRAPDKTGYLKTCHRSAVRVGICRRTAIQHGNRDGFRNSIERQVACELVLVPSSLLDAIAPESHSRILLNIEEVRAFQVIVP